MPSSYEQITGQLKRLSLVFDPPMAKTVNGEPNPKYAALVAVYVESLQPFQPWEMEAGIKLALENHSYKHWPKPAELRKWCLEAQAEMRPKQQPLPILPKPDRREVSREERQRNAFRLAVLRRWTDSGDRRLFAPDGLQQCKAIAAEEQQAYEAKIAATIQQGESA